MIFCVKIITSDYTYFFSPVIENFAYYLQAEITDHNIKGCGQRHQN